MVTDNASKRRIGRGRLSSINMLPPVCDEDIAWAVAELRDCKIPQTDILDAFNARLAAKDVPPVSKGAFSRWSIREANERRRQAAARDSIAVMPRTQSADQEDGEVRAILQALQYRLAEAIVSNTELSMLELQRALASLEVLEKRREAYKQAARQKEQDEQDEAARKDADAKAERDAAEREQAAATAEHIATEAGLSADRVAAIRRGVLGLTV